MAQDFTANGPDQKWGADISYIWTAEGWLYLAVVLDLFSRRVVGWATSDRLKRDLAVEALRRALVARKPAPGLVHHSDRGSQYCSVDYQALLRKRGIQISMSGRGNCYDNSMVETFLVVSRMWWKLPSSGLRACNDGSSQAARSRDIGSRGWDRVSQPSTFRIWI